MTPGGGSGANDGTVFSMNPDGTAFNVLHPFLGGPADGKIPLGTPVVSGGAIYGMTSQGGTANLGTVFRMNTDGTGFQVIHSFAGGANDGSVPSFSSLVVSAGAIYGMTIGGGPTDDGVVFTMSTDGTGFTILHAFSRFNGDGWGPSGGLTLVGQNLFGMTRHGGATGLGTIFKVGEDGVNYNAVHTFSGSSGSPPDGANPDGTLYFDGTRLYGSTVTGGAYGVGSNNALGVLFGLDPNSGDYNVLNSFDGGVLGGGPGDVIAYNGSLYGMTGAGGTAGDGTIYSLPLSVPEPSTFLLTGLAALAIAARERRRRHLRTKAGADKADPGR